MFYYYGAKNQLAKHYPTPKYDTIIEPFAGSAAYACYHLFRDATKKAILIEKDPKVADLWRWCLGASKDEIEKYPTPPIGDYTSDFFIMTCAASNATAKCQKMKYTERVARVFNFQLRRVIKLLSIRDRITVIGEDYSLAPDKEATWFIDPPYQTSARDNPDTVFANGNGYSTKCNSDSMDFSQLGDWCRQRKGQVIVCEKEGATWLPFNLLKRAKTSLGTTYNEVVWTQG